VDWTFLFLHRAIGCLPDSPKLGLGLGFRRIGTEPCCC